MKKALVVMVLLSLVLSGVFAEGTSEKAPANEKLVVGFAQIGQESGWRGAETTSITFYAAQNLDTIQLHFADAQQKQENQIKAVRSFIQMGVDVIGLAPVVETGWETVLKEAKEAEIPVIFVDRMAKVPEDLYATFIGSDFIDEGQKAAKEMIRLLNGKGKVVMLEGTVGASAAIDRQKGFLDAIAAAPGITVIARQSGDFTRSKGKEVMESFLKSYPEIDGAYADNDDMMLGAIEAMKEAGKKPGTQIKTVSVDGVKGIFEAMVAGEANVTVECNPLLGPQFFQAAADLKAGKTVPKWIKSNEDVYRQETAAADLPTRLY
ncbi:ABC transporter substrate-binding protein [Sphaerochaeta sp.]|uniref:ABC transporter substrate-binding protein n=1 Tax=Sphaerochaeta sp. TaxID=1972642 RepID=UPI003D11599C